MKRHLKIRNNPLIEQLCEDLNNSRDIRDLALFCSFYIDYFLNKLIIKTHNKRPEEIIDNLELGSYSNKIKILYSMGIINEQIIKNLKLIGEIRNYFSHNILLRKKIPEKIIIKIKSLDYLNNLGKVDKYDYSWEDHANSLMAQLQVCGSQLVSNLQKLSLEISVKIKRSIK
jgi:DNA-binding MltR family transcriptional regulator